MQQKPFSQPRFLMVLQALLIVGVVLGVNQQAAAYVELNAYYVSESFNPGAAKTKNRMFVDVALGFSVDKQRSYLVGWEYTVQTVNDTATTTDAYASSQMGPRFVWMIDKAKTWSLGFAYLLVTSATYTSGTAEKWTGTAIKVDGGYNLGLSDNAFLGLRLNYSSASYTSKLVNSTTYSTVGYTAVFLYPSLTFVYLF